MRHVTAVAVCCPALAAPEVVIEGLGATQERNVRSYLALAALPCQAERVGLERALSRVDDDVAAALAPYGHYSPTVDADLAVQDPCWAVRLRVDPGPAVLLRDVAVTVTDSAGRSVGLMPTAPPLVAGQALRHGAYDDYKASLLTAAAGQGYLDAKFATSRLDIWPDELAADVVLRLDAGPRYMIGEVLLPPVAGGLDPALLRAYLRLAAGDPFDPLRIARAQRALADSGYFARAAIVPELSRASGNAVPLRVDVDPAARVEWSAGLGAATDTGLRLKGGYRNRRVNARGDRIVSNLAASQVTTGWTADYRRPAGDPRTDSLGLTVSAVHERTATADTEAFRVDLRRTKRVRGSWLRTVSLEWSRERFVVADRPGTGRVLMAAIGFDRKSASADLYPDRGYRLRLDARVGHAGFAQMTGRVRWIRSVGAGRLLARAAVGATVGAGAARLPLRCASLRAATSRSAASATRPWARRTRTAASSAGTDSRQPVWNTSGPCAEPSTEPFSRMQGTRSRGHASIRRPAWVSASNGGR